nr:hypothetical protein BaRGS_021760 [Batillaria attramentaria]
MAAIHAKPGSHVWGVVWELDESDKEHLDQQHQLPEDYIKFLESFADNGYKGEVHTYNKVMEIVHKEEKEKNETL